MIFYPLGERLVERIKYVPTFRLKSKKLPWKIAKDLIILGFEADKF